MIENERLLTRDQVEDIYTGLLHGRRYAYYPQEVLSNEEYAQAVAQAQRALTLKAVGEWLEENVLQIVYRNPFPEHGPLLDALKEGRMP